MIKIQSKVIRCFFYSCWIEWKKSLSCSNIEWRWGLEWRPRRRLQWCSMPSSSNDLCRSCRRLSKTSRNKPDIRIIGRDWLQIELCNCMVFVSIWRTWWTDWIERGKKINKRLGIDLGFEIHTMTENLQGRLEQRWSLQQIQQRNLYSRILNHLFHTLSLQWMIN